MTSSQSVDRANMHKILCYMLANDGNLQKRGQIKPFSQPKPYFSVSNVVWWILEQSDSRLKFRAIVAIYEVIVLFQKLLI